MTVPTGFAWTTVVLFHYYLLLCPSILSSGNLYFFSDIGWIFIGEHSVVTVLYSVTSNSATGGQVSKNLTSLLLRPL